MFIEVTKDQFYAIIYAQNLNVHPRPEVAKTYWEMQDGSRKLFGYSEPGYKNPCTKKVYAIAEEFLQ